MKFKPGDRVKNKVTKQRGTFLEPVTDSNFCYVTVKYQTWSMNSNNLELDEQYARQLEQAKARKQKNKVRTQKQHLRDNNELNAKADLKPSKPIDLIPA